VRGLLIIEDLDRPVGESGPLERAPRSEGGSLLVVVNRTQRAVWNFNVKGYASGSWGHDLLECAILPGRSAAWEVTPGLYHLRAENSDGLQTFQYGVDLGPGQVARWVLGEGG
jgi:hypothetical protein